MIDVVPMEKTDQGFEFAQCLKWNPALSLYKRHGFVVIGETDTHFQMERSAGGEVHP